MKKQCRRDKTKTKHCADSKARSQVRHLVSSDLTHTSTVERCRRKKPNVCLLSPVLTSSLPPLSPSAPPVLAVHPVPFAEPAGAPVHSAVQRQPQHPQSDKLPWLLQWGVLPAADRTDQRDGEPGGQRSVAVCCEGPGVLHSRPKGKNLWLLLVIFFSVQHQISKIFKRDNKIHKYFIVNKLSEWSKFWTLHSKADIWALCRMCYNKSTSKRHQCDKTWSSSATWKINYNPGTNSSMLRFLSTHFT